MEYHRNRRNDFPRHCRRSAQEHAKRLPRATLKLRLYAQNGGNQSSRRADQRNAGASGGTAEVVIERGERQTLANCQFEIGGIIGA